MREIVIAGGCFWGVEAFFKLIVGIKKTKVGYANSVILNPTYEEVCSGATKAVEAVHLTYNPKVITLEQIIGFLFRIIDPTSLNKQGGDIGTQYRTGIYFSDDSDQTIIQNELISRQKGYDLPLKVENKKLLNFYDAELYHQDYLTKNPNGYCHVVLSDLKVSERKVNKPQIYKEILNSAKALFTQDVHPLSMLSNFTALIKDHFSKVSWVGFYLVADHQLVLGPFQGKLACTTIAFDRGVCGASFSQNKTIIVEDVHEFEGHIACDSDSNSEIVLPVYDKDHKLIGVLDLDSHEYDNFDAEDELYLQKLLKVIEPFVALDKIKL